MGIEEEILDYLNKGYTPTQLIEMGYKKSTVYKVYSNIKTNLQLVEKPKWIIEDVRPNKDRYLPGETASIKFYFRNATDRDLYLYRIGLHAEWMKSDEWLAREVREVLKPGQKKYFSFSIDIPRNLDLGEYELRIGMEGQYLPPLEYSHYYFQTYWSLPIILEIKHPLSGITIFISHSVKDLGLVRRLESQLDNHGIKAIVAEDTFEPGSYLGEKIKRQIRDSTLLLAILTHAGFRSEWVRYEIEYAHKLNKPLILLKEKNLRIKSDIEWIEFSYNESIDSISLKVMKAINYLKEKGKIGSQESGWLVFAILALLFGLILGG